MSARTGGEAAPSPGGVLSRDEPPVEHPEPPPEQLPAVAASRWWHRPDWRPLQVGERLALVVLWGVVVVVFSILAPSTFPTTANFSTIFSTQAVLLIMSLGLVVALTAGEYDLSVGSMMAFSAVILGVVSTNDHWGLAASVLFAVGIGVVVGVLNAVLVVWVGISSFVATLGTGTLLTGLAYGVTGSETIGGIPSGLITAMTTQLGSLQLAFFYGVGLCILLWYVLGYTPLGRHLLFVGEGREVARLSGLRVNTLRAGALISCSVVAALAGVVQAGVVGAADPSTGPSFLLPTFASAFLGATAIRPGRFNAWGTFVAVYFLVTGITGLQLLGYTGWVQDVWYGASLVVAVGVARMAATKRASRATSRA